MSSINSVLKMLIMFFSLILVSIVISGCQSKPKTEKTLYQELGGKIAIERTVYQLVSRLHTDKKFEGLFVDVNRVELTQNIEDFLCQVSDGGCEYFGAEMIDAHTEMHITKAEFDYFVSLFIKSMTIAKIDFTAQNKLLARLAKLRPEIIEI